jgi:lactose/L-arabinose transport system ATP-binding protein
MAQLELSGVRKRFGNLEVIHGLDLQIEAGEFVVLVGPSGCGKSTALRLICGLENLSAGDIRMDGKSVRNVAPSKRGLAMVFQSYALYPHMSVAQNMGFSLRVERVPKVEREQRVLEAAKILQLDSLLDRKPKELSGGQRQRVAIGRAIVRQPKVFLFDEPLSNLDAELRVQMRFELARLHRELGATMVYVTHDQVEAMTLADRIVVLRDGRVEQVGAPMELYRDPVNAFVAGFIGSPRMNFFAATVDAMSGGVARLSMAGLQGGPVEIPCGDTSIAVGDTLKLGLRPENLEVDGTLPLSFEARIDFVERLGGTSFAYAPDFAAGPLIATADLDEGEVRPQETRRLTFSADRCFLFRGDGSRIRSD